MSSGRRRRGGDLQAHHVEAVVQVFAEQAPLHLLAQGLVGGGHDTHVGVQGLFSAHPFELAVLDDPQQGKLGQGADLGDFIKEYGAVVGQLETAGLAADGPGEGALFMAEQLRTEQGLGIGRAVDHDKGTI